MVIKPGRYSKGDAEPEHVRAYESGYRDGHEAGYADAIARIRSGLYAAGRDERPNWYAQGYNNGYVAGHETGRYDREVES